MPNDNWLVMDGRAFASVENATVMEVCDTAEEACEVCNRGDYGDDCVVVGPSGEVAWSFYATGEWQSQEDDDR